MFLLKPLRRPRIALIWGGLLVSATGDQFYQIAIIWLAASLVGSEAGYLSAAQALSICVVGLLSGTLVDRWDNRRTMIGAELIRMAALASLPVFYLAGLLSIVQLYFVAILAAATRAFYQPALQASLPVLIPDAELRYATNGLLDGTRRFARILGAGMIGTVALLIPVPGFFAIAAATCLITILAVLPLRRAMASDAPVRSGTLTGWRALAAELAEVARAVSGHRALLWSLAGSTLGNAAWNIVFVLGLVLHVQRLLPGEIGAYGTIMAGYGIGNVAATLLAGSLRSHRPETLMFAGRCVYGLGIVALALAPDVTTLAAAAAFASIGGPMNDIPFLALMQRHFPARQIGRVYGLRLVIDSVGLLVGSVLAALAFAALPTGLVIAVTGGAMIAFGLLAFRFGFERYACGRPPLNGSSAA